MASKWPRIWRAVDLAVSFPMPLLPPFSNSHPHPSTYSTTILAFIIFSLSRFHPPVPSFIPRLFLVSFVCLLVCLLACSCVCACICMCVLVRRWYIVSFRAFQAVFLSLYCPLKDFNSFARHSFFQFGFFSVSFLTSTKNLWKTRFHRRRRRDSRITELRFWQLSVEARGTWTRKDPSIRPSVIPNNW